MRLCTMTPTAGCVVAVCYRAFSAVVMAPRVRVLCLCVFAHQAGRDAIRTFEGYYERVQNNGYVRACSWHT